MPQKRVHYRLLSDADVGALYRGFIAAFSDYQVNMNVSLDRFRERLVRDGVHMQLSAAAFVDDEIVGFYINALGDWQGKLTAYDSGTGIVPNYRRQGIGEQLFVFLLTHLREARVKQYLLEVITSNTPAVNLYRKLGFKETRSFAVFLGNEQLLQNSARRAVELQDVSDPHWQRYQSFWDGQPSWQNSIEAVQRIQSAVQIVGALLEHECIGYGILHLSTGNLMQLAVSPAHRRKGVGSSIVRELQRRLNPGDLLKVINIDTRIKGEIIFYEAIGFTEILRQFEMIRSL